MGFSGGGDWLMWADLQETFYLTMGPFIGYFLLPVFMGSGAVVAVFMALSRYWHRPEKVILVKGDDD